MKDKKWIIAIIIAVLVLGTCFVVYKVCLKKETTETKLVYINADDLENKINNKESFVLVMSQTGCSHCEQYLPELDRTLKEVDFDAYVLNISNLDEAGTNKLNQYVHFSGTPTTLFYKDGEEKSTLNRFSGYVSKTKIIERLKSLGYIN